MNPITLIPLQVENHAEALQEVYQQTPSYWEMYNLPGCPTGQAERDLNEAANVPGRTMMGIAHRLQRNNPNAGAELIGLVDFRMQWPEQEMAYLGMIMVVERYQRRGVGQKAWRLLMQWLRKQEEINKVRLGVEQFNPVALKFFTQMGFQLTGDTNRIRVSDKLVRLLYMEYELE